jgi:hypothetical protein
MAGICILMTVSAPVRSFASDSPGADSSSEAEVSEEAEAAKAAAEEKKKKLREERKRLKKELAEVDEKLRVIKLKAAETPAVKLSTSNLHSVIESEAIKADPEKEEVIVTFFSLQKKLQPGVESDVDPAKLEEMKKEMDALKKDVAPALGGAMASKEVSSAREALMEAEINAMKQVDPETEALMDRHQKLLQELHSLRQRIQSTWIPMAPHSSVQTV